VTFNLSFGKFEQMRIDDIHKLLADYKAGIASEEDIIKLIQTAPLADLGFAKVDTHRSLRKDFPEVIFGQGKTPKQIVEIAQKLLTIEKCVLVTRASIEQADFFIKHIPDAKYHESAKCIVVEREPLPKRPGYIAILCAGTSDIPIAEEAAITASIMGNNVERIYDVGVSGIHRLFSKIDIIRSANVIIAVAGMEGALPSVVAGLVAIPVIAVPTSIGYGTSFGGLTALLAMLNSCASGILVVNIDNGFGAGCAASQINALVSKALTDKTQKTNPTNNRSL